MSDATQTGVSETDSAKPNDDTTTPENPRQIAMEQLAEAHTERMRKEQEAHDLENGIVREVPKAPPPEDQVAKQLSDEVIIDEAQLAKYKVRTKVDGVEQVVSVSTMRTDFQKQGAADKRLAEASELLKQARAVSSAPASPPVGHDAKPSTGDSTPAVGKPADEVRKEFVLALFEGDMDKAMAAFERVLPGASATQSLDQLTERLTPQVRQQLANESALDKFATDFDYLVADPYLADLADLNLRAVQKEEPTLTYAQQLEKAGEATRDWMVSKGMKVPEKAPAATAPTTDRAKKLERKAASDQVAGTSARAVVQQPEPETPSSVIAQMRKSRGMEP